MSSLNAVTNYDAYGPLGAGVNRVEPSARPGAPTSIAPQDQAPSVAAGAQNAGTLTDVTTANAAAKSSADLFGNPSPEYASAMSEVVGTAAARAPKIGGRLDTQM